MSGPVTVLVLGGTDEARELAAVLAACPDVRVVVSLAGRLREPRTTAGQVRTGGFGGPEPLADWINAHAPTLVVDATHPFATRVSRNATEAAARSGAPLLRIERPGWSAGPDDRWHRVPDLATAATRVATLGRRPLVTIGRRGLAAFVEHPALDGLQMLVRCIEPPDDPLPDEVEVLLDRGPFSLEPERRLLRERRVDVVVTKDSGGDSTRAKLDAARELGLPVVMVDRRPGAVSPPQPRSVPDVDRAVSWVRDRLRDVRAPRGRVDARCRRVLE